MTFRSRRTLVYFLTCFGVVNLLSACKFRNRDQSQTKTGTNPAVSEVLPTSNPSHFADILERGQVENRDFRVILLDRPASIMVMAIHGGLIEPSTSDLARAIAGQDLKLYLFEGLRPNQNLRYLHITSTRFDEPRLMIALAKTKDCLSLHGFRGDFGVPEICLGGKNGPWRDAIAASLRRLNVGIKISSPCDRESTEIPDTTISGIKSDNVVNRCQNPQGGVQLELSRAVRDRLLVDPAWLDGLAKAIRAASPS